MKILKVLLISISVFMSNDSSLDLKKTDTLKFKQSYAANLSINDLLVHPDSLDIEDLFESQLFEAKLLLAESIIADLTGDTLGAKFQFDLFYDLLPDL